MHSVRVGMPPDGTPGSTNCSSSLRSRNFGEVVYQDSPAHPPTHALLAVVRPAREAVPPAQHADASFHAGSEREGPPEPKLPFVFFALLSGPATLRQGHAPYPCPFGRLFARL